MTTMHPDAAPSRPHAAAPAPPAPGDPDDGEDVTPAEETEDLDCIRGLVATAERSAGLVDDGMNATEASEERHAVAEAQAMR